VKNVFLILATTTNSLYQFVGTSNIQSTLAKYARADGKQLMEQNSIVISPKDFPMHRSPSLDAASMIVEPPKL
jgi:hypothetical protein